VCVLIHSYWRSETHSVSTQQTKW